MGMAERLQEGVAPWRDPEAVRLAVTGWVRESLGGLSDPDKGAFVAERDGEMVGFVCVSERSHFTGEVDAYIGELVVSKAAEGGGVGDGRWSAPLPTGPARRGRKRVVVDTGQPTCLLVGSTPLSGSRKKTSRSAERSIDRASRGRAFTLIVLKQHP